MLLKSIRVKNLLSFGPDAPEVELKPLNVLIGPNGSGKSNLLDVIGLLQALPRDLQAAIRAGGGITEWMWKGKAAGAPPVAAVGADLTHPLDPGGLSYSLQFLNLSWGFQLIREDIIRATPSPGGPHPYMLYEYPDSRMRMPGPSLVNAAVRVDNELETIPSNDIDNTQSIFSQLKDRIRYPDLTDLGNRLSQIRIYRDWIFGRHAAPRLPQRADMPNDYLEPDGSNLGLVLNRLQRDLAVKKRLLAAISALYDGIDDYHIQIEGGTVQVFFHEGEKTIPATRLSDGTLRYLCLVAILCHPKPPPLVCIEEPELGLHPDVMPTLAGLLKEASERGQLIVTTHSDMLVDALSDQPDSVVVMEKGPAGTVMQRLDAEKLKPWLEHYRLGQLWNRGDLGGTRW